ncbi:MAG: quinolinate synthase NadA [Candidatus Omnitrophica bacterium]|nr:quinolinate synthase NadA [Candidatus Omnitrophota bacterium]
MAERDRLKERLFELKRLRRAAIVAHNYQHDEVQEVADITGDSLALSQHCVQLDAPVIVFAGVDFMAESAAILNPEKTVLLPEIRADCPMSKMAAWEAVKAMKSQYPDAAVVAYVNCSAEVKAEADICCTSANAVKVVSALPHKRIVFVPDRNLGHYVQRFVPDKEIILWKGFCPTHQRFTIDDLLQSKREHPDALFVAHPECRPEVLVLADHVCSTSGMVSWCRQAPADEFIVGTESGMLYRLRQDNPAKRFYLPTVKLTCPTMKMTTLDKVVQSLELMQYQITVDEAIRVRAKRSLDRMLAITQEQPWAALAGY